MVATVTLGGPASHIKVAKIGVRSPLIQNVLISDMSVYHPQHGLMKMTWTPRPVGDEQAFEAIKAGIDALPQGVKAFLNGGPCSGPWVSISFLSGLAFQANSMDQTARTCSSSRGSSRNTLNTPIERSSQ
jgi:hypothetical protein